MLALLVRVLQFLVALFFLRLIAHTVAAFLGPRTGRTPRGPESAELVRDRVCNTFVPRSRAVRAVIGGREESFCSTACRDRARGEVARAS